MSVDTWGCQRSGNEFILEILREELERRRREVARPFCMPYRYVFSPAALAEWKRVEAEDKARRPPPDREVVHKVGEWWVVPGVSP